MANLKGKNGRIVAAVAVIALLVGGFVLRPGSGASEGGTITYLTHSEAWTHADPNRNYTGQHIAWFGSYMHRTLTAYARAEGSAGSAVVADLATDTGRASNENKTWEFTLRDGVTFEDGSAITCEDIKYGVSRTFATDVITDGPTYAISMLDIPKAEDGSSVYKGPYATENNDTAAYDKAVTCSDDNKTITFNLSRSVGDFNYTVTYLSFSPVPKAKDTGDQYDLAPVSSGPYKIEKYKAKDEMVLVRNDKWSKDSDPIRQAYPDKIVVRFGLAEDVRDQIMLDDSIPNTVNLDGLMPANNRAFFDDPKKANQRMNVYDPYVRYAAMNVSAGHMDCLDIRKAVFFAVNTQALIDLSGGSVYYGVPGDSPVKPVLGLDYKKTTGNIHDANWKITGNPTYAASLLEKAKTSCPDAYSRATAADKGIVWDIANTATNQKAAVLIGDATKAAGINMKFNFIPSGQYYSTVQNRDKQNDISSAGWGADWANASTVIPELFTKEGGFNLSQNWNDAAYAAFKTKSDATKVQTDRAKQAKGWQELAQYVMDQYWIIRPVFSKGQFQWGSGVGGVYYWEPQGTFGFGQLYVK